MTPTTTMTYRPAQAPDHVTASLGFGFVALAAVVDVLTPAWPVAAVSNATAWAFVADEHDRLLVVGALACSAAVALLVFVSRLARRAEPHGGSLSAVATVGAALFLATSLAMASATIGLATSATAGTAATLLSVVDSISRLFVVPVLVTTGTLACALLRSRVCPEWLGWALLAATVIGLFVGLPGIVSPDPSLHIVPARVFEAWVVVASVVLWRGNRHACSHDLPTGSPS